jgi:Protein of unknown function (DUF3431)
MLIKCYIYKILSCVLALIVMTRTVVVARYGEDVSWVNLLAHPCIVYNKGRPLEEGVLRTPLALEVSLPNVGRESETYLHFICANYDSLPPDGDVLFCQGDPFDHVESCIVGTEPGGFDTCKGGRDDFLRFANTTSFAAGNDFTPLGNWYSCDGRGRPHSSVDLDGFLDTYFSSFRRDVFWFVQGAQFIVSCRAIQARPLEFYRWILRDYLRHCSDNSNRSSDPAIGHVMERSWVTLFDRCGAVPRPPPPHEQDTGDK